MKMKKFINDPSNLTQELLEGLALSNQNIIELTEGTRLVVNKKLKRCRKSDYSNTWRNWT